MRHIFHILICSLFFIACKSDKKVSGSSDTISKSNKNSSGNRFIEQFRPIIQGAWVSKDYIDVIAKTKSPFVANEKLPNISTILIETKYIKNDTVRTEVGYGNHEGGELMLKFQPGKAKRSIVAYLPSSFADVDGNSFALGYIVSKNDTTLLLYTYNMKGRLEKIDKYFRVFKNNFEGHELGYATYYAVDKSLITGIYKMIDTNKKTSKVKFDSFGKVADFNDFLNYSVDVDFETPPGNNMDQINFDAGTKHRKSFAFKFDHDTLNLYNTSLDKDSIDLILGKRVYKLIKQN